MDRLGDLAIIFAANFIMVLIVWSIYSFIQLRKLKKIVAAKDAHIEALTKGKKRKVQGIEIPPDLGKALIGALTSSSIKDVKLPSDKSDEWPTDVEEKNSGDSK